MYKTQKVRPCLQPPWNFFSPRQHQKTSMLSAIRELNLHRDSLSPKDTCSMTSTPSQQKPSNHSGKEKRWKESSPQKNHFFNSPKLPREVELCQSTRRKRVSSTPHYSLFSRAYLSALQGPHRLLVARLVQAGRLPLSLSLKKASSLFTPWLTLTVGCSCKKKKKKRYRGQASEYFTE